MVTPQKIRFQLRDHQRQVKDDPSRFKVPVMHRRAGKSVLFCGLLMSIASQAKRGSQYHYVGPSIKQTKAIAWIYVTQIAQAIGGCKLNQAELKVTFSNGATLELLGVENIDSLRGRYSNGIVLDEAQLMPQSHWAYVIRPLLADRLGWAVIGGTPAGKHNLLGWAYITADKLDDWSNFMFKVGETDALQPSEIESMKREMSEQAWSQEMECDFDAAIQGAYFAEQIRDMNQGKRYTTVRHDDSLPVTVALDLGHNDLMPVMWAQQAGSEHRVIHVETYRFTSIPDMVNHWKTTVQLPIDVVILPHDARVRDLTSGKTRQETFQSLGMNTTIAPSVSLLEGIEQSRQMLKNTWIDQDNASQLFEALAMYRSEMNDQTGVTKITPVHDWASHFADMFRYYSIGDKAGANVYGARNLKGISPYA